MHWFTGVIEDRQDPYQLGRVRVRIFGLHTDDQAKISVNSLPWAHVMMPVTSASISGVGWSPTGLVEGSWVVGFFADGENMQDPIVLGSIHGYPSQTNNEKNAFKDSENKYPRWLYDTDVSYVARDKWVEHASYVSRNLSTIKGIEKSTKPTLSTTVQDAESVGEAERETWDEPDPREGIGGQYPYVHVFESESGIVKEYDDTPGATRIVEHHPSGTFYEIYPDGKRSFKVVGDNYEIIIGEDNILVRSNQNVTVEGDARLLVKGDYNVEVVGDYNLKVLGNRNTKISGNDSTEILGNYNLNVTQDYISRVGKNQTLLVDVDKTESIGGTSALTVVGKVDQVYLDTYTMFSNGAQAVSTNSTQQFLSKDGLDFGSQADWVLTCNSNMTINVAGRFDVNASGDFKVLAEKIELN